LPDAPVRIKQFVARMRERPAYQRALERGGPFDVMS
jgi:hypothetical protein